MNMNSSDSHLTWLITMLKQLSAKEKVGGLGGNASTRMNSMAKQFLDMFPSLWPYSLQNFSRGQQTKEELLSKASA